MLCLLTIRNGTIGMEGGRCNHHDQRMNVHISTALALTSILLSLCACDQRKPKIDDAALQRLLIVAPGMTKACAEKMRFGGVEAMPQRVEQCFEMSKPQRWRGLWLDAFETQLFCPAPAQTCELGRREGDIWISFANDSRPAGQAASEQTYVVDFIGRSTVKPGIYGHGGIFSREIVVDKLMSISPVAQYGQR